MRIGVISDTHDRIDTSLQAVEVLQGCDMIVHCGDWKSPGTLKAIHEKCARLSVPLRGVLGNNDTDVEGFLAYARRFPEKELIITEGVLRIPHGEESIHVYHGHHAPTLKRLRGDPGVSILLLGHTHKPKIEDDTKLIVNPGSLAFAIPRSKTWRPSYAVVDIDAKMAEIRYVS